VRKTQETEQLQLSRGGGLGASRYSESKQ
jgi:hypothetical protein